MINHFCFFDPPTITCMLVLLPGGTSVGSGMGLSKCGWGKLRRDRRPAQTVFSRFLSIAKKKHLTFGPLPRPVYACGFAQENLSFMFKIKLVLVVCFPYQHSTKICSGSSNRRQMIPKSVTMSAPAMSWKSVERII